MLQFGRRDSDMMRLACTCTITLTSINKMKSLRDLGMTVHTCNLRTGEVEVGGAGAQGQYQLHGLHQTTRLCL